ncbi:hypothetical protein C1J03_19275 [Sulfitobacter sp. SK012]|uniref:hypothetical protein n=1 Tax=Sulfitobacter sp. SK012 TaxID=1389005 RepID=UPI000E0ADFE4|nr:hypothetical protein [Sulfitobacter sp. SK012]AXI47956.1 hypothetical protein C1J03_19275 [Sulfitobacter sp. SK012]
MTITQPAAVLLTFFRPKIAETAQCNSESPQGRYIANTLFRVAFVAIVLATISDVADAKIVECAFSKATSSGGMGNAKNTRAFLGEAISLDTSKKMIKVQWSDRASGWRPADEMKKNKSFTSYIIYQEVKFRKGPLPMKFLFRLSADESGLEVRSEVQKSAGSGREWKQLAARYKCK